MNKVSDNDQLAMYIRHFRRMADGRLTRLPNGQYVLKREKSSPPEPKPKINIKFISPVEAAEQRARGQVSKQHGGASKKRKRDSFFE